MKKLILLFTITLFLTNCKKDNDTESTPGPLPESNNPEFSAMVNGTLMIADSTFGWINIDTTTFGFPLRYFSVFCKSGNYIFGSGFFENTTSDISIISVSGQNPDVSVYFDNIIDTINQYTSINANFSITFADTIARKASGNFSGTLVASVTGDTIVITNGKFKNITYTDQ